MAGPSCVAEVMLSMWVVIAVAEEVESLNRKLYDTILATLEDAPARAQTLIWQLALATRAQMVLVEAPATVVAIKRMLK